MSMFTSFQCLSLLFTLLVTSNYSQNLQFQTHSGNTYPASDCYLSIYLIDNTSKWSNPTNFNGSSDPQFENPAFLTL